MTRYLLDTNILLRILGTESAQKQDAVRAISVLRSRGDMPCITPQVLIELWCVATRPVENNGFGWDAQEIKTQIDVMLRQFPLLGDTPTVFSNWLQLVSSLGAQGK